MKKIFIGALPLLLLGVLSGCGGEKKTSVSVSYSGDAKPVQFAISDIKSALERNNLSFAEGKGDYEIIINPIDSSLGEQAYKLEVEGKKLTITGGDVVGTMYGGFQIAESINLNHGMEGIQAISEKPYIMNRGFSTRAPLDARTPCYTNQADSVRNNAENTWDLDFWKGLIDTMARKRYNTFTFSTVNSLASLVKVPGYEEIALDDVWIYTGDYDDTYLGNCTNMFRPEHIQEGNYRVFKKMSIDEKTQFWYNVFQHAVDRGIKVRFGCMSIYTFAENGHYGITDDRANETTKDYFYKGYKRLLEAFPQISALSGHQGENMDYPVETANESDQWIYDTYARAVKEVCLADPERAKNFVYEAGALGNNQLSDYFLNLLKDFPCHVTCSKRYNDTHLYTTVSNTDNVEYLARLPEGIRLHYSLRNEDAYHLSWGNPDYAREYVRNIKHEKVYGFQFGIDGYNVSGKEYEFKDDTFNGKYYFDRHWVNYTMFGRFSYNPDAMSNEYWEKLFVDHYREVDPETVKLAWKAMNKAAMSLPTVLCQHQPGGTDAAFLAELCWSNPTLYGFLDIKRFVNSDLADPDSDVMSFAEYARRIAAGETSFAKKTPLDSIATLRDIHDVTMGLINQVKAKLSQESCADLYNLLLDQECLADMSAYYADKFETAVYLRRFNDTTEQAHKEKAVSCAQSAVESWRTYSSLWDSRFKPERIARHGYIDPISWIGEVEKDVSTCQNWKPRAY